MHLSSSENSPPPNLPSRSMLFWLSGGKFDPASGGHLGRVRRVCTPLAGSILL